MAPLDYVTPTAQAVRETLAVLTHRDTPAAKQVEAVRKFRTIVAALPPTRRRLHLDDILDRIKEYRLDQAVAIQSEDSLRGLLLARQILEG